MDGFSDILTEVFTGFKQKIIHINRKISCEIKDLALCINQLTSSFISTSHVAVSLSFLLSTITFDLLCHLKT